MGTLTMFEAGQNDAKTKCQKGNLDFPSWQLLEVGQRYTAKRRRAYGLLCSSIQIPNAGLTRRIANDNKAYTYEEFVDYYGKAAPAKWQAAAWEKKEEL